MSVRAAARSSYCMSIAGSSLLSSSRRALNRALTRRHSKGVIPASRQPARIGTSRETTSTALLHRDTRAATQLDGTMDICFLDEFAVRQWDDPNYGGTRISFDKADFVKRVHQAHRDGAPLVDGYAPFCKHIFVPNFVGAKVGALEITGANRHLLQSGYTKRRPEEMAVLTRWFTADQVEVPEAKYLDIILYSREQLVQEYAAMPSKGSGSHLPNLPWGIISVKAQDESFETPMQPITMMRNALGREEGGSGVALDKAAYSKSVEYWEMHATIVAGSRPNGE